MEPFKMKPVWDFLGQSLDAMLASWQSKGKVCYPWTCKLKTNASSNIIKTKIALEMSEKNEIK